VSRPLLRVFCPAGDRLAKVVTVADVGAVVVGYDTRHKPRFVPLAGLLTDVVTVDQSSRLTIDDKMPVRCRCRPDWIPGTWLRDRLADGRGTAVWEREP
jgi:hypothetical protein